MSKSHDRLTLNGNEKVVEKMIGESNPSSTPISRQGKFVFAVTK